MKSSFLTAPLLIAAILLIAGLLVYAGASLLPDLAGGLKVDQNSDYSGVVREGVRAPHFSLADLDGERVSPIDMSGTPLIIAFVATWSEEGANQIKILDDYLREVPEGESKATVLAVDTQEERSVVLSFMRRGGYGVRMLIDEDGGVAEAYGVKTMPTLFFVDKSGAVKSIALGTVSQEMLVEKAETIVR